MATVLPPVEALLGALFLLGILPLWTGLALLALLALFSAALTRALVDPRIELTAGCGCNRAVRTADWKRGIRRSLVRNAALAVAAVAVLAFTQLARPAMSWPQTVVAGAALLAVAVSATPRGAQVVSVLRWPRRLAQQTRQTIPARGYSRRRILRLGAAGVASLMGVLVLGRMSRAYAYTCDCACDSGGNPGGDCQELCIDGIVHYVCDYYCCPPAPRNYCDSSDIIENACCL